MFRNITHRYDQGPLHNRDIFHDPTLFPKPLHNGETHLHASFWFIVGCKVCLQSKTTLEFMSLLWTILRWQGAEETYRVSFMTGPVVWLTLQVCCRVPRHPAWGSWIFTMAAWKKLWWGFHTLYTPLAAGWFHNCTTQICLLLETRSSPTTMLVNTDQR